MPVRTMNEVDQRVVRAMIEAATTHPELFGSEYDIRLGVSRDETNLVLKNWPPQDESVTVVMLVINNSLNEMCYGIRFREGWPAHLPCSREKAIAVFDDWLQRRDSEPG